MTETLQADLAIIGGGYAAINALNAASHHLQPGSRVVIIAKESRWGGQWVDQYDFVRLHQPYRAFTAGERKWDLPESTPYNYLATKREILRHFEGIARTCAAEKDLELVELFGYEAVGRHRMAKCAAAAAAAEAEAAAGGGQAEVVEVSARPLKDSLSPSPASPSAGLLPSFLVRSSRLIRALGANIEPKRHLRLTATEAGRCHSLLPRDVLRPEWNVRMCYGADADKPIVVVGSGKTAVDVIVNLTQRLSRTRGRLQCITGRGTFFMNRNTFSPDDWWTLNMYGSSLVPDLMAETLDIYDGTNAVETLRAMEKRNFIHSPFEDPQSFVAGICSEEEVAIVRAALAGDERGDGRGTAVDERRTIKGHLLDIVLPPRTEPLPTEEARRRTNNQDDGGGVVLLKVRALDGSVFTRPIPAGSFVINCTDHVLPQPAEPVLQGNGLVLAPQFTAGFTGPSANMMTHLFYLNLLEPLWRKLPRFTFNQHDKARAGLDLITSVVINAQRVRAVVPKEYQKFLLPQAPNIPLHRLIVIGLRMAFKMPRIAQKVAKIHTKRFTDVDDGQETTLADVLAGRIGILPSGDSAAAVVETAAIALPRSRL